LFQLVAFVPTWSLARVRRCHAQSDVFLPEFQ
jgi:hypothetical protein